VIDIRAERTADLEAIRTVNTLAFGQDQEARIVDALRDNDGVLLSLVAVHETQVVGHILFSPASIEAHGRSIAGAALGPMAVLPAWQRQGIGGQLIETGLRMLRDLACPFVIVLGHPDYYPRFGFAPANSRAVRCQWDVPDEAFMLLVLDSAMSGALKVYACNNQAVACTPWTLAGAMSPCTVAGTLTQVLAEALACLALVQLINPGAPCLMGSFASAISMQSGAPTFGNPEGPSWCWPRASWPDAWACRCTPWGP